MKTYVFDIDGTICTSVDGAYEDSEPLQERINEINKLFEEGNTIIFQTARGMGRTWNNATEAHKLFFALTQEQLESWGVKYHSLFLGKPSGDVYVDDKGINDEEFFRNALCP